MSRFVDNVVAVTVFFQCSDAVTYAAAEGT